MVQSKENGRNGLQCGFGCSSLLVRLCVDGCCEVVAGLGSLIEMVQWMVGVVPYDGRRC